MTAPRFTRAIGPKQRRAYGIQIREALAANPNMTLGAIAKLTGASTGIVQYIAASVRREAANEGNLDGPVPSA